MKLLADIKINSETGDRMPPHVYCQAASAYCGLRDHTRLKLCLSLVSLVQARPRPPSGTEYFVSTARQKLAGATWLGLHISTKGKKRLSCTGPASMDVEQRILGSNPILEGFGNAKTNRNNNSSRFGKWMEVTFMQEEGLIELSVAGSSVQDYLLETSRVTDQADGERNFHIFYQVCAMFRSDDTFGMSSGAEVFHYLGGGNQDVSIQGLNDRQEMEETLNAMKALGFGPDEVKALRCIVAGPALWKYIIRAQRKPRRFGWLLVAGTSEKSVEKAAQLLGLDTSTLRKTSQPSRTN